MTVTVNGNATPAMGEEIGRRVSDHLTRELDAYMVSVLIREQRPGGALNRGF